MVNIGLLDMNKKCTLIQIDVDELWTKEQIYNIVGIFKSSKRKKYEAVVTADHLNNNIINEEERFCAYFHCHYFITPELVTVNENAYSHNNNYEWLRVWNYKPTMSWIEHAPPALIDYHNNEWVILHQGIYIYIYI